MTTFILILSAVVLVVAILFFSHFACKAVDATECFLSKIFTPSAKPVFALSVNEENHGPFKTVENGRRPLCV